MARALVVFLAAVLALASTTTASAQSVAHKGGSKKPNVAPVCAATKSAWSSTTACTAFKNGICDTVTSAEGCDVANRGEMVNTINAQIAAYTTPIIAGVEATYPGCVDQEVFTDNGILFECTLEGLLISQCPEGYIATQRLCVSSTQQGENNYTEGEFLGLAVCPFTVAAGDRTVRMIVTCQRAGIQVNNANTASAQASPAQAFKDQLAKYKN